MNNLTNTGKLSKSPVISRPYPIKPHIQSKHTISTKPKNVSISQSNIRKTAVPSLSTNTTTHTSPEPTSSSGNTLSKNYNTTNVIPVTQPTTYSKLNYASAAANEITPCREQTIVFNTIDGTPQRNYVIAIGQIIGPNNITNVSRISNNRFCIFLSNKQILDSLIENTSTITVNNEAIQTCEKDSYI